MTITAEEVLEDVGGIIGRDGEPEQILAEIEGYLIGAKRALTDPAAAKKAATATKKA